MRRFELAPGGIRSKLTLVPCMIAALAAGAGAQELTPANARLAFAEAEEVVAASGGIWSQPLRGPVLFVDRATRRAIGSVADSGGVLSAEGGVYVGTLPDGIGIANMGFDWGGRRWTMLVWPLPAGPLTRRVLLGHEMFHAL